MIGVFIEALLFDRTFSWEIDVGRFDVFLASGVFSVGVTGVIFDGGFSFETVVFAGKSLTIGTLSIVGSSLTKVPCRIGMHGASFGVAVTGADLGTFVIIGFRKFVLTRSAVGFFWMALTAGFASIVGFLVTTLAMTGVFTTFTDLFFIGVRRDVIRYGEM
jgi:hypothetical protein